MGISDWDYLYMDGATRALGKVTRLEVIDDTGRAYVKYGVKVLELSLQDDGRTLKVFANWGGSEQQTNDTSQEHSNADTKRQVKRDQTTS